MTAAIAEGLAELGKLAKRRPSLADSCATLRDILTAILSAPAVESPPCLDEIFCRDKLASGIPLLRGEKVTLDAPSFRHRWRAVCEAAARQNPGARGLADAFADPQHLFDEVLAGRPESVHEAADAVSIDPSMTATILRLTSFPVLAKVAADLEPSRRQASWEHGCCPTCGSWPLLGEFRGLEQLRFLRCGLCASEWGFPRLCCPFCGIRDHRELGYLHIEGEEARFRAATCNACMGYVKMASTLAALSPPQLLVAELATVHLDMAAAERGYLVV
ncbi:MAG: formate dehydrogenase accessory protein FdhE [Planctomycetes bacterium]|nr:formate dehydrogenase accessory protein FdhE [Planctomycetota bacterium]